MRRIIRAIPALLLGGFLGALVQGAAVLALVPFLAKRLDAEINGFEFRPMVMITGVSGILMGFVAGAVVTVGAYVLRRPDDPMPRKPPARVFSGALAGAAIGGFFGFSLAPVALAIVGNRSPGGILIDPDAFAAVTLVGSFLYGMAAAGFVVGLVPSIASVTRRVRIRAQHLYAGPVRNEQDLAVLVNRIKEGGEDALAAGKEFHLH